MKRLLLILGMVSVLTAQTATIKNSIIGYTTINEKHDPEGSDDRNGDEYESTISFEVAAPRTRGSGTSFPRP